ncbi:MAG: RHS repeat-associated core domain-containing protein [Flavobacteriales bacterium]
MDKQHYLDLLAQDSTWLQRRRDRYDLQSSRDQISLKRYDSDKEVLLSVEELLGEGKSKSGANGLPFYYLPPEHSTTLKEVTYYLHDHLGNMRLTYSIPCVAGTQVPTLLHAADYYPYGSILRQHINGAQEKYLTTHHERDLETGLDYRGARYYDSDVARFLSLDPLAGEYASLSPYNFVAANPVSFIDPDGKDIVIHYGNNQKFIFNGSPTTAPNPSVQKFIDAYYYNTNNGGGKSLLEAATNSKITLNHTLTHETNAHLYSNVYWSSSIGLLTTNGNVLSPATILEHEVAHALDYLRDPQGNMDRATTSDPNYTDKEEKRVITGPETCTAQQNGEVKSGEQSRYDHRGTKVVVAGGSTSNKIDIRKTRERMKRLEGEGYPQDADKLRIDKHLNK